MTVVVVFSQLPEITDDQAISDSMAPSLSSADDDLPLFQTFLDSAGSHSSILLPLGPNDGRLPGLPQIWDSFLQSGDTDYITADGGGFDGLQAVESPADFSKNAVAELFLSGYPDQLFMHSGKMLVLNTHKRVQVIDCMRPDTPKLSGYLPYSNVTHMEMRGDIAYLLTSQPNAPHDMLVVTDLHNPLEPLELVRNNLPKNAETFFFSGRQLVVYVGSLDQKVSPQVYIYDLVDDDHLELVGSAASPRLRTKSLKFGNYILVPGTRSKVYVYDYSDPLHPGETAVIEMHDIVRTFVRHGDKVFALGGLNRVYVIDMHVPGKPVVSTLAKNAQYPAFFVSFKNYTYYFTLQGFLQVYDTTPYDLPIRKDNPIGGAGSDLVVMNGRDGFTLLGKKPDVFPPGIDSDLVLPPDSKVLDTAASPDGVAILQEDGLVRLLSDRKDVLSQSQDSLRLAAGQRWLAAGFDRLYVGGGATISVIARDDRGQLILSGQVSLPGKESWDGFILGKTLCLATGKDGLMMFSLDSPDKPTAVNTWTAPLHLRSQIDVRQLASPGGNRLLAGAGRLGLLDGKVNSYGRFELQGILAFQTPVSALAMLNQLCLVATADDVQVVDLRNAGALQKLGRISYSGVARLAVAPPDYWAGFVPGTGWSVFSAPRILSPEDISSLEYVRQKGQETDQRLFRLNLFNDDEVMTVPGTLKFSAPETNPDT